VVSSQQGNARWVFQFHAAEILEGLHRITAPVHVIPYEHIACAWDFSSGVEEFK
jgi:hypothetical protein